MSNSTKSIGRGLSMVLGAVVSLAAGFIGAMFLLVGVYYLFGVGSFYHFSIALACASVCFAIPAGLRWLGRR